jgi:hypothetical protein
MTTITQLRAFADRAPADPDVQGLRVLQSAARARVRLGQSLDHIERELIERSGLNEEAQSALWLYTWSYAGRAQELL